MEILSPAGNFESLVAAVRSGADAVYLGLKDFSARRNAENFDLEEFTRAAEYCRVRGVKVYVALNTMIKQKEIPVALSAAKEAYARGADAFIVSDLGLISVLREALPKAALHASTQMTVHSPAALKALKALGIKRAVLSREMSREQIREFCAEAKRYDIEVEVFVHGALCMCVSGQCLLSSALGGRSGNRGLCAGPCRLEFSAKGRGRYDLSLKDLSLTAYLNELKEMGVASAKIEGRMKRPEYVAAATAACKKALEGQSDSELTGALKDVFSRSGFTDGYFKGKRGADMFGIRTKDDAAVSSGAFSYLHGIYRNERASVPVDITATIKNGESIKVIFSDGAGNSSVQTADIPDKAVNKKTDKDAVAASLSKLGGTPYFVRSTDISLDDGLFVGASCLNELRRRAVEDLSAKRAKKSVLPTGEYTLSEPAVRKAQNRRLYARFNSVSSIPSDLSGVAGLILPLETDFPDQKENILKITHLPRYITDESKVLSRLQTLKEQGVTTAYCDTLSALCLAKDSGFKVIASNFFNCANSYGVAAAKILGADEITLSAETYMPSAKQLICDLPTGIFAYGRLPLMLTLNCPIKNAKTCEQCKKTSFLTDRMGVKFPVYCRDGYSEVFNCAPIYLADKRDDLSAFDFLLLSFFDETPDTARKIIDGYMCGGSPEGEFTRGIYYNNIP